MSIFNRVLKIPYKLKVTEYSGSGKPIIFLHGINSRGEMWQNVIGNLPDGYRVITIDLLGFGDSPKPDWPKYTVKDHVKAVNRTIRSLKLSQPALVVGHSMGSLIALQLAYDHPSLVNKLILCSTPFYVQKEVNQQLKKYQKANIDINNVLFAIYERLIIEQDSTLNSAQKLMKITPKDSAFSLTKETWVPFKKSLQNTIMKQDSLATIKQIKQPIVLFNGITDLLIITEHHKNLAKNQPNISIETAATGHMINKLASKRLAKIIAKIYSL